MDNPKKILIIQLKRAGDVILTTPIAELLKRRWPQARVDFLVEKAFAPLLENNPAIDVIQIYDKNHVMQTLKRIRAERYDQILDFQSSPRSAIVVLASGARATTTAIRRKAHLDPRLAEAVTELAETTRALDAADRGHHGARADVRERASRAVELAGAADVHNSLWPTMIFGQTRAIAFDLMQASGEDADAARSLLDAAATTKIATPPPRVEGTAD